MSGPIKAHLLIVDDEEPQRLMLASLLGRAGYEVDAARRVVTHKQEFNSGPNSTVDAVRGFEFDGDLLILTVEPARQLRVVWRKRL